ncbi:hypothetical protein L6R50_04870 [Myxococcota bacterium]|nr:hypothetical protein [Myxococcota bacterium]
MSPRSLLNPTSLLAIALSLGVGCAASDQGDDDDATGDDDVADDDVADDDAADDDAADDDAADDDAADDDAADDDAADDDAADDDAADDDAADDDTADDDTSPPPAACPAPWGRVVHALEAGGGAAEVVLGAPSPALAVTVGVSTGAWATGDAPTFELTLENLGGSVIEAPWDNCGYPVFTVRDEASDVVWSGSESDGIECLVPGTLSLAPGASLAFTWPYGGPALAAGRYTVEGAAGLALDPDALVASFGYSVVLDVEVSVGGSECAPARAAAPFTNGLRLDVAAEPHEVLPGEPVVVSGGGAPEAVGLGGEWLQCGTPLFYLRPASDAAWIWDWSEGYVIDCAVAVGWPLGSDRRGSFETPDDVFFEAGGYAAGVLFTRRDDFAAPETAFVVEVGVSARE